MTRVTRHIEREDEQVTSFDRLILTAKRGLVVLVIAGLVVIPAFLIYDLLGLGQAGISTLAFALIGIHMLLPLLVWNDLHLVMMDREGMSVQRSTR